jgi:hypothetical protein
MAIDDQSWRPFIDLKAQWHQILAAKSQFSTINNQLQPLNLFQVPIFDSPFQHLSNYKLSFKF